MVQDAFKVSPKQRRFGQLIARFRGDTGGATAIEYAIIASAIAVVIATAVTLVGSNLRDGAFTDITSVVSTPQ
jgi:pilus assembly protein Flp/PilA